MTTILWNETVPSDTSQVAQAPSYWRSEMTAIATGLATDLYWDGSGGASDLSRGVLHPGASRTFVGGASASSYDGGATNLARAFFSSASSTLFVYDSTGTYQVGSPLFMEYGSIASMGYAPSNVSTFREVSGSTTVSDITTAGGSTRFAALFGTNINAVLQVCFITCSERSVFFNYNSSGNSDSGIVHYIGAAGSPSTATFSWTAILLMNGSGNSSGIAV